MRSAALAALACLALCAPVFPEEEDPAPDEPTTGEETEEEMPEFSKEEGLEKYRQAVEAFRAEKWEEAERLFREALRTAADKSRAVLQDWAEASECGARLERLETAIRKDEWRAAWNSLNALEQKYGRTRIKPKLDALRIRIEAGLYSYLATFERDNSPAGSLMPPGAEPNTEPKYVKRGAGSAKWAASVGSSYPTLTLGVVDGDRLAVFPRLNFWVYAPPKNDGQYLLVLDRGSRYMGTGGSVPKNVRYKALTFKSGWTEISLDVRKDFDDTGLELERVKYIQLILQRAASLQTIYIDEVRLERK